MPRNQSVPRFLEFFAGAGLVRQGLGPSWQCVFANDNNPKKQAVYKANFGDGELCSDDIKDVVAADLPDADLAWASFPCQDLSLAGWQRGMIAKRSGTFWAFWCLLRDLKRSGRLPPLVVLENVTGVLRGQDFDGLCEALAALGLQFGALTIDARHFVPQSRPRVFFVASAIGFPPRLLSPRPQNPWASVALCRAVTAMPKQLRDSWVWLNLRVPSRSVPEVDELLSDEGAVWFDEKQVAYLVGMMTPLHKSKLQAAIDEPGQSYGFLYRRRRDGAQRAEVRFDGLAGCLRTPVGGSSRQTVVEVKGNQVRMRLLTAREAARLMGAPDGLQLPNRYNDAYLAMGDGVCVPAVSWLADNLLMPTLTGRDSPQPRRSPRTLTGFVKGTEKRANRWLSSV